MCVESIHKPTILVFTGYYFPGYKAGGILRNLTNTVDNLSEFFDFRIVTRDHDLGDENSYPCIKANEWQQSGNAQVYYLPGKSESIRSIGKLIKETKHDVLFLTSYFDPLTIMALCNRRLKRKDSKPVIVAPFGEFAWASFEQKLVKKLLFISIARLLGLYKGVIWRVSSVYEANDLKRVMNPPEDMIKITGDLPIKVSKGMAIVPSTENTLPRDKALKIIFLSRIAREKNLNIALSILKKVKLRVLFDIYGPTENSAYWLECQKMIDELPSNITARYCGNVHPNKVIEVFSHYDLFLFPTGGEAYGNVIAESLTSGTPVLISTVTPWRNLQANGLGWDIELDNIDAFVDVIEHMALQSESERFRMRNIVKERIQERLFDANVLESNRRLFDIHKEQDIQ